MIKLWYMTWQYIAGFFDGEGSLVHNKKGYRIMISQTNEEVLTSIKEFIGFGNIFKNKKRQPHWLESWVFYIAKQEDVLKFLKGILPFLIVKKIQIDKALPTLTKSVIKINYKINRRIKRVNEAKKLREQGLTYRQIGKQMKVDFGYARRLILGID